MQSIPTGYKTTTSGLLIPVHVEEKAMRLDISRLTAYLNHLRVAGKAKATIEKYSHAIEQFLLYLGEKALTVLRVREWATEQLEIRAVTTVNNAIAALNGFFRWMGRADCVLSFFRVQESQYRPEERALTLSEYNRMVAVADAKMKMILQTFYATGIRVSELRFFTLEAVQAGQVKVNNKGKIRTVFIPPETQKSLLAYAKQAGIESGVLFRNRAGAALSRSFIWREMKRVARAAGIAESKVFPHNLRHLFAIERYKEDHDIEGLRLDMGHSQIATTQRYLKETLRERLERLKKRWGKQPGRGLG